jgi:hypothetical protein
MQMVLAPNDLFSWNNKAMSTMLLEYLRTFFLLAMHINSLCACSHSEAMKGSSSLRLLILSRLLASPVWAQLTLTDPTWGPVPLLPRWRPFLQGPRTLPYRGPEQFVLNVPWKGSWCTVNLCSARPCVESCRIEMCPSSTQAIHPPLLKLVQIQSTSSLAEGWTWMVHTKRILLLLFKLFIGLNILDYITVPYEFSEWKITY